MILGLIFMLWHSKKNERGVWKGNDNGIHKAYEGGNKRKIHSNLICRDT
jgi:hypothetical protein